MLPQEWLPPVAGVPNRGGHGVRPEDVIAELESAGFRLAERRDGWGGRPERFCVAFEVAPSIAPETVRPPP
jgi:hypothetical protein